MTWAFAVYVWAACCVAMMVHKHAQKDGFIGLAVLTFMAALWPLTIPFASLIFSTPETPTNGKN